MLKINQKFLMSKNCGFILKTISSTIKNWTESALGVNKTYAPPLTYLLLLSSVPLYGNVHYLNEMVTEFMKQPVLLTNSINPDQMLHFQCLL